MGKSLGQTLVTFFFFYLPTFEIIHFKSYDDQTKFKIYKAQGNYIFKNRASHHLFSYYNHLLTEQQPI